MNYNQLGLMILIIVSLLVLVLQAVLAQLDDYNYDKGDDHDDINGNRDHHKTPKRYLIVIIAVVSLILLGALTLLLPYCGTLAPHDDHNHQDSQDDDDDDDEDHGGQLDRRRRRVPPPSGIDTTLIESLPLFKFSTLKGSKQGLECGVCLSEFKDAETLRLLPNCTHAFHTDCIDRWLAGHSTCPICRFRVISSNTCPTNLSDDPNVELFVQREQQQDIVNVNIGLGSSSSLISADHDGNKINELDQFLDYNNTREEGSVRVLHKLKHRIIISAGVLLRNRWSDLSPSDLLSLSSESNVGGVMSSQSLSINDYNIINGGFTNCNYNIITTRSSSTDPSTSMNSSCVDEGSSRERVVVINNNIPAAGVMKRSMSEITNVPRFEENNMSLRIDKMRLSSANDDAHSCGEDHRRRTIWLQMVQRTVQWFAAGSSGQLRW